MEIRILRSDCSKALYTTTFSHGFLFLFMKMYNGVYLYYIFHPFMMMYFLEYMGINTPWILNLAGSGKGD